MIAIIDYDAGNIKSVQKAFEYIGEKVTVTRDSAEILSADKVILPGVGAFGDAMEKLHQYQLVNTIYEVVEKRLPFLGICLGMQLLFESSEESPGVPGLNLLEGKIIRIPDQSDFKIPHIGWNSLELKNNGILYQNITKNPYVYFVHSYYLKAKEENIVTASTEYVTHIHASVQSDRIFGCQFHPEKSGEIGLKILENFANIGQEDK